MMLRRTKEELIEDLPQKNGGNKPIGFDMTPEQIYPNDSVIWAARISDDLEEEKD